jgi:amidophosphoribosyltransferase
MCGIIGIMSNRVVSQEIYDGLTVLQHRGQDSAGIMTYEEGFNLKKGNGLVRDVFHTKNMIRLRGSMGIGHVRYPTAGSSDAAEAQPFYVNSPFGLAMIHNGNLTNYDELKKEVLKVDLRHLNTKSDSELLLNIFARALREVESTQLTPETIFKAMEGVFKRLRGSYSVIGIIADYGMVAFRDPYGIRPLCIGKREESEIIPEYIIASESVAVDTLGYKFMGDIQPGEAVFIDMKRNLYRKQVVKKHWAPCIFEHVYLARPDSILDDVSVYKARIRMGVTLAKKIKAAKLKIDVVVPVPDSARSAALSLASELGINYREGLVKNRYIGRTFIMPGQEIRKKSIKYKLNPIKLELNNRNVLLVDDSIVRGNTSKKIVEMVRQAGAKNVYFASCAPPLISPCLYGVDMPSKREFVANGLNTEEICKVIGADRLFYQDVDALLESATKGNPRITGFCYACMGGKYPTHDITKAMLDKAEMSRGDVHKIERLMETGDEMKEDQLSLL